MTNDIFQRLIVQGSARVSDSERCRSRQSRGRTYEPKGKARSTPSLTRARAASDDVSLIRRRPSPRCGHRTPVRKDGYGGPTRRGGKSERLSTSELEGPPGTLNVRRLTFAATIMRVQYQALSRSRQQSRACSPLSR